KVAGLSPDEFGTTWRKTLTEVGKAEFNTSQVPNAVRAVKDAIQIAAENPQYKKQVELTLNEMTRRSTALQKVVGQGVNEFVQQSEHQASAIDLAKGVEVSGKIRANVKPAGLTGEAAAKVDLGKSLSHLEEVNSERLD